MAAVVTVKAIARLENEVNSSIGNKPMRMVFGTIAFDNSYPTGGEAITLSTYFPGGIECVDVFPQAGYVFVYDKANAKVIGYQSDDAVDPLDQIGNTTDLSALTAVPFVAYGYN